MSDELVTQSFIYFSYISGKQEITLKFSDSWWNLRTQFKVTVMSVFWNSEKPQRMSARGIKVYRAMILPAWNYDNYQDCCLPRKNIRDQVPHHSPVISHPIPLLCQNVSLSSVVRVQHKRLMDISNLGTRSPSAVSKRQRQS